MTRPTVTGLILAGGRARRLGGVDKGLVDFAGKPLIEYVIEGLRHQVERLLINANRNADRYRDYGFPVIADDLTNFQGPLAGVATALRRVETDYLLTAPCDGPRLPRDLRERLMTALADSAAKAAVAHDGKRAQYAFALLHRDCGESLSAYLDSGERSIRGWFATLDPAVADFSDKPEAFFNINRPTDLAAPGIARQGQRIKSSTGSYNPTPGRCRAQPDEP